jgi:gluconate kinase
MVIVVIGEVESGGSSVGRLLAESLGWEFAEVESLDCAIQAGSALPNAGRMPQMQALSAVVDSSNCQWRDVIVSCPTLTDKDHWQLRRNHPSVKFVYLKAPDRTDHSVPSDRCAAVESDGGVLSVDSSQGVEQILGAVLSALILKQRSVTVRTA